MPGETRVGPARLSLEQNASRGLDVVFFHDLLMAGIADPLVLDLDGEEWTLTPDQWAPGEPGLPNVIAAFHLSDPALAVELVQRMKAGRRLVLRHPAGEAVFSLCGVTAALDAIEAQGGEHR